MLGRCDLDMSDAMLFSVVQSGPLTALFSLLTKPFFKTCINIAKNLYYCDMSVIGPKAKYNPSLGVVNPKSEVGLFDNQ